jgi:hypothetical protein
MKDNRLAANSDHPAFTSILEPEPEFIKIDRSKKRSMDIEIAWMKNTVYAFDHPFQDGDYKPKDWTETHYAHEGHWVPHCAYFHQDYVTDRYAGKSIEFRYVKSKGDYESYDTFKEEAIFLRKIYGRRKTAEEREIWKMMQDRVNAMRAKNGRP